MLLNWQLQFKECNGENRLSFIELTKDANLNLEPDLSNLKIRSGQGYPPKIQGFTQITQSYEAQFKTWWYRILALKL